MGVYAGGEGSRRLSKPSGFGVLLVGILLLALALWLWGIGFGLPYEYHVDEVQYVRQAASMGAEGLEPVWWNNPPFFKYLLLAEFGGLYGVGRVLGWYASTADLWAQSSLDPSRLYLLGRATSAVSAPQPLAASLRSDVRLTRMDTRTLAKQWIEWTVPAGARIAVDYPFHGPPLSTAGRPYPASVNEYDVLMVGGAGLADHPIDWYRDQGIDYLIASSSIYSIPLAEAGQDAERRAFYASLDEELEPVQQFRPDEEEGQLPFVFDDIYGPVAGLWKRERPGPAIKIYRIE